MPENYQRRGALSNAHVGNEFECEAIRVLADAGLQLKQNFPIEVGVSRIKKIHSFDLGSDNPPVLVECKSHRWTRGSNVPSAKMTVWNEVMYYFSCAPSRYRKILFVLRDSRVTSGETLSEYYIRTYSHLIPDDVEIWEFNQSSGQVDVVYGQ